MTKSQIYHKKKKTLDFFVKNLLKSPTGKDISHIVLFDSVAKGEADEGSDIDLAIFTRKPKLVEDQVSDLSYDILLDRGEAIEPHIYSVS